MDRLSPALEPGQRRMHVAVRIAAHNGDPALVQPGEAIGMKSGAQLIGVGRPGAVANEQNVPFAGGPSLGPFGGLEVVGRNDRSG